MSDINTSATSNSNFRARAQIVLSVALAYAIVGWVGLVLAIPPGYATPVFPAAGLAVACVLWFGPTVLAGIWLGSALLNLSHPWWAGTLTPSTAVVAMVIATGATLQAWVGSWLVCRWQGSAWRTLEREQDVFVFLMLGGVLSGVISSLTGVSALQAFGIIDSAEFLFTAWNWYVGDVLGVLVFAPLTLCLLNRDGELWRDRRRRIVMPMLLTLGLVALAFYGAARWEREAQQIQLEADSEIVFNRIADRVIAHREVLSSLKRFVEATPDFSFEQFEVFTRITLQDNPDIFALSFNDLIADKKRPAFESMMSRLSPLGSFQITERDAGGKLIRAMTRPEYVTVRYIVPLSNNQPAVGYDIYSEPVRRAAINRARASSAMAVTAPIRLVQEQRQRVSVLEILPVTRARAIPEKEQPGRIVGFAVAVVKVDEMIEIATKGHVPAGLVFQLTDPHAPDGQGLLYHPGSPDDTPMRTARAAHWKTTVRMGDRDWELSVYTTEDYRRRHRSWMAWAVSVVGLLFAALLQILLLGMTGRTFMQKMAREKLAHSYDLMRYIIEHANSAVAVHDRELRYIYVSQRYLDEYKVKERDVIGKHLYDIFPDLPQKWRDGHQRALAGEVSSVDRDPYYRADGTTEWTRWECRPWFEAGGTIGGIIVYTEVITERVWAEKAMIRSEALLSKSQEIAHIGSWERDLVANRLTWSHEVYRIFGVLPEEFTPSVEAFFEAVHPDDREKVNAVYSESVREGRDTFEIEHRLLRGDNGEVRFVLEKCEHVKDAVGSIVRSVGMVQDITERRQAEAALRESEERYRSLIETTSDWIWEVDAEARYVYASDKVRELLGYTPEEVIGRTPFDLMPETEARRLESQFKEIAAQWLPFAALENTNLHKNGRAVVLETSGVPLFGPNGKFRGYRGMDRDITERKRAEEALRESEERFSVFMSHLPASAFIKNADGRMVFANRYLQELFGIQDYAGKTTPELIPGELAVQMTEDDRRALAEGVIRIQETFRDTQGRERTFETLKFPIHSAGKPVRLGGVAVDITGLKQTEAALRASLEEKTALLQEVHHRVKNNLQIVSSLLNLQAGQERSQLVLAALRDTQNRVRSMAMLHEMLYRSESLAQVNIAAYLEALCANLFRALGADPNRVRLDCHTATVELGLDQAVPCGLIVNELVSNALEHAFSEGRAGCITVELRRDPDDRLTLTVADDGVGLPADLDFSQTSTLGLQLVSILTAQLKGTLGMERGRGTSFQVTFPSH